MREEKRADQTSPSEVTRLLTEAASGDGEARDRLWSVVYGELRRLAHYQLRGERSGHLLQTTALVNEAYMSLTGGKEVEWEGRAHFFTAAAEAMRRICIDEARRRLALKRGGDWRQVDLEELERGGAEEPSRELVALDEALGRLEEQDERRAEVVKLRFFAGCTEPEIAQVLGISERSVSRLWAGARAWLYDEMARPER